MLDISFYDAPGTSARHIEVAEPFLSWLARTDFSTLGEEQESCILITQDSNPDAVNLLLLHPARCPLPSATHSRKNPALWPGNGGYEENRKILGC